MRKTTLVVALSASLVLPSARGVATTLAPISLQEIARDAEVIAEGTIQKAEPRRSPDTNSVYTAVTVEVVQMLKGPGDRKTLELQFAGGSLPGRGAIVPGVHPPPVGEHGVYFVESITKRFVNPLLGWDRGRFIVRPSADGPRVFTADGRPVRALDFTATIQRVTEASDLAVGVNVAAPGALGMSLEDFKKALIAFLQSPSGRATTSRS